jgi:hypothetical protein
MRNNQLISDLIWSRLPGFWSRGLHPDDRDALEAMYFAYSRVLDAEYVRLHQVRDASSLESCPVYSQRRWLRLDLNQYAIMRDWLRFLALRQTGDPQLEGDRLYCSSIPTAHIRHWHFQLPYVAETDNPQLDFGFPVVDSLIEAHRMTVRGDGAIRGLRLSAGRDFELLPTGQGIQLNVPAGSKVEITVGFDFSSSVYAGVRPIVYRAKDFIGPNVIRVPAEMDTGFPLHAIIYRQAPPDNVGGMLQSNTSLYQTRREYLGTDKVVRAGRGLVALPGTTVLGQDDVVYLIGTEFGDWDLQHSHTDYPFQLPAGTHTSITLPSLIARGVFADAIGPGRYLQIRVGGELLDVDGVRIDAVTSTVYFQNPLSLATETTTSLSLTAESRALADLNQLAHLHYNCNVERAITEKIYGTFDDGGIFDDDADPDDLFDSAIASNVVYVDYLLSAQQLRIFVDGQQAYAGSEYRLMPEGSRTRIAFSIQVEGKAILLDFRRETAIYTYGLSDIFALQGLGNVAVESLGGDDADLDTLINEFAGSESQRAMLRDAAMAVRGRANPLLALFLDEHPLYAAKNVDSTRSSISASAARALESQDTDLVAIPFLVDHPTSPTVLLRSGNEYRLVDGEIQSSIDLLTPRPGETQPGVWWCPLVLLDEHLLARNFGSLVDDNDDSSEDYRSRLRANFQVRFGGSTYENVQNAVALSLGSPAFSAPGTVLAIQEVAQDWTVVVESVDSLLQASLSVPINTAPPALGAEVFAGQSIVGATVYDRDLTTLVSWSNKTLVLDDDLVQAAAGDTLRMQVYDAYGRMSWFSSPIRGVSHTPRISGTVRVTLVLEHGSESAPVDGSTRLLVLRDAGGPYAPYDGRIVSNKPRTQWVVRTTAESVTLPQGVFPDKSVGETVVRGAPVRPSLAQLYDDTSRPGWQWQTPSQVEQSWRRLLSRAPDRRFATVVPGVGDFAGATFSPVYPEFARGTRLRLTDDVSGRVMEFTAAGGTNLYPNITTTASGVVEVISGSTVETFDSPIPPRQVVLTSAAVVGQPLLFVSGSSGLPERGSLRIPMPAGLPGGCLEATYGFRDAVALYEVVWGADTLGVESLPVGQSILCVSELRTRRLNPALQAVLNARKGPEAGPTKVRPDTADAWYDLLAPTCAVLETSQPGQPKALRRLLQDCMPAQSTVVLVSRQIVVDTATAVLTDRPKADPRMTVVLDKVDPTNLAVGVRTITVRATVVDAVPGDPTFAWSIQALTGSSAGITLQSPTDPSCRFDNLLPGASHLIRVTVVGPSGQRQTASLTVNVS